MDADAVRRLISRLYVGTAHGNLVWTHANDQDTAFTLIRGDGTSATLESKGVEDEIYPILLTLEGQRAQPQVKIISDYNVDRDWDNDLWELYRLVRRVSSPLLKFIDEFAAEIQVPDPDDDPLPF